ncbi:hypothetical protein BDV59DRAFT_202102 [Aspergillus ambiguus]|uniref:uncharacterized protein n=1 Tax=Aspergillus ambiguus TaxID=176160 RepID=UPI003CCCB1B0
MVSDEDLNTVQDKIAYRFKNRNLLRCALTTEDEAGNKGRERLAMFGDAALKTHLATEGHNCQAPTERIARVVSDIIRPTNMAAVGLELTRAIEDDQDEGSNASLGVMATTANATLGAVWFDCDCRMQYFEEVVDSLRLSWAANAP